MSESCNSVQDTQFKVQDRHPRPLGTWSPSGCSAQANYLNCKGLRQLSLCPLPSCSSELLCDLFKPQPACRSSGLWLHMHKAKHRGNNWKFCLQKAILDLAGIGLTFSIIALSCYVFDLCWKQGFHWTPDIPGYSLLLNTGQCRRAVPARASQRICLPGRFPGVPLWGLTPFVGGTSKSHLHSLIQAALTPWSRSLETVPHSM